MSRKGDGWDLYLRLEPESHDSSYLRAGVVKMG